MHRDHKIGLALAVLLIGLAAALCFPRTRLLPTAELESVAATLNNQSDAAPAVEIAGSDTRRDSFSEPPSTRPTPNDDAFAASSLPQGVADVIVATPAEVEPQRAPKPEPVPSPAQPEPLVYTIQIGDTLSGLAHRFLGSSARYQELFDANRDVLNSPDRLEPGVQIRIPGEGTSRTESHAGQHVDGPAVSGSPAGFQQPSRTPFDVRRR